MAKKINEATSSDVPIFSVWSMNSAVKLSIPAPTVKMYFVGVVQKRID